MKSLDSSSTLWTLELDASNLLGPTPGAPSIAKKTIAPYAIFNGTEPERSQRLSCLRLKTPTLKTSLNLQHIFFNAPVERVTPPRATELPTLSELAEVKVASRFRNALYTGHELGPRYHFAAQCSAAEEILSSISLYREAPLTLSALPSVK